MSLGASRAERGERREERGERRAESGERRAESGERRAESGERRAGMHCTMLPMVKNRTNGQDKANDTVLTDRLQQIQPNGTPWNPATSLIMPACPRSDKSTLAC